jgi:hypothetical protein
MSKVQPLDNEQLRVKAPSLFTQEAHHEVSDKYHFIPTIDVVDKLRSLNWYPVEAKEATVRDINKDGFQQHYVRFQNFTDLINVSNNVVELLLFNSHDRSKAFSIGSGVYRYVCENGLVIADSVFDSYKIKHLGDRDNDIENAVARVTEAKPKLLEKIDKFENIILNSEEKEAFMKSVLPLRFEKHLELDNPKELLRPLRSEDMRDDLYTTMNVLQENLLSANISGYNKDTGRRFSSKAINSINKDIEINKGLWEVAERIASIKVPSYKIAV